jgi:protein-tyrosine phosphatase
VTAPALPEPLDHGRPYRIALVCLGNICRSPMADVVLRQRLLDRGLADRVEVVSAGTGGWHVGAAMDERAAAALSARGYDPSLHRARRFSVDWFADCDLVLAMDRHNHADLLALTADERHRDRLRMFRDFDPQREDGEDGDAPDVPDPYFGHADGFAEVLAVVERTSEALADRLVEALREPSGGR